VAFVNAICTLGSRQMREVCGLISFGMLCGITW